MIKKTPLTFLYFHFVNFCLKNLSDVEGTVLDLGCGSGVITSNIKRSRPDLFVYGGDINNRLLAQARFLGTGVEFVFCDIYNIPFADGSFDAVIMIDLLEHVSDPDIALEEIRRVLKPKGLFCFSVPLEGDKFNLIGFIYHLLNINIKSKTGHLQLFSRKQVFDLLLSSGFSITCFRNIFHYFYQLIYFFYWLLPVRIKKLSAISSRQPYPRIWWLRLFYLLANIESFIFSWLPGHTILISARRSD